jgi:hypothetical protein
MTTISSPSSLSDEQLIAEVKARAASERQATAQLIASLAELDARRLYLGAGCASLFAYCTRVLHLSEHAAYGRIEAARAVRRFPSILERLAEGELTLTAICQLAPYLTPENVASVLQDARHRSKREIELLVAALSPKPTVPSIVRKLPGRTAPDALPESAAPSTEPRACAGASAFAEPPAIGSTSPARVVKPPDVAPLTPTQYKVQCTISRDTYEKLRRAQDLLRHVIPNGDPAAILDRALTLLVADLEKKKIAASAHPRAKREGATRSRHVPAAVKREVWKRDGGQCAFEGTNGRCGERGFLEFHHVVPYAMGGETATTNLQLRCRGHNAYEAEQDFGPWLIREAGDPWLSAVCQLGPDRAEHAWLRPWRRGVRDPSARRRADPPPRGFAGDPLQPHESDPGGDADGRAPFLARPNPPATSRPADFASPWLVAHDGVARRGRRQQDAASLGSSYRCSPVPQQPMPCVFRRLDGPLADAPSFAAVNDCSVSSVFRVFRGISRRARR